jgi:hypothetical protein
MHGSIDWIADHLSAPVLYLADPLRRVYWLYLLPRSRSRLRYFSIDGRRAGARCSRISSRTSRLAGSTPAVLPGSTIGSSTSTPSCSA